MSNRFPTRQSVLYFATGEIPGDWQIIAVESREIDATRLYYSEGGRVTLNKRKILVAEG